MQEAVIKIHISSPTISCLSCICLIKYEPFSADYVNLGKSWWTWSKWPLLQQYTDKPAKELTAFMQPNLEQEFVTVFLEPESPLSPHFGYSLGWCNRSLISPCFAIRRIGPNLSLWAEVWPESCWQSSEAHESCGVLRCPLVISAVSLSCIKHTRSTSVILTVVWGITAVLLTVSPLQPELQITRREEKAKAVERCRHKLRDPACTSQCTAVEKGERKGSYPSWWD